MPKPQTTADLIKRMHAAGFRQDRIAAECKLSQPTVSNYIQGNHKLAREDVALRVREAYDRLLGEPAKAA